MEAAIVTAATHLAKFAKQHSSGSRSLKDVENICRKLRPQLQKAYYCCCERAVPHALVKQACDLHVPANLMLLMGWTLEEVCALDVAAITPVKVDSYNMRRVATITAYEEAGNLLMSLVECAAMTSTHQEIYDEFLKQVLPNSAETATSKYPNGACHLQCKHEIDMSPSHP